MSYVGQDFPPCDITEVKTFSLDFSAILVPGEAITNAVWNIYLREGVDPNPGVKLESPPAWNSVSTSQQVTWSSGTNSLGNVYTLQCVVTTSAGNQYEQFAECAMAVIYAAPISPISLAEQIKYKLAFASAPTGKIVSATVIGGGSGGSTPPGLVTDVDTTDTEVTWTIDWTWWVITITIVIVTVTFDTGDVETVTVPIEVVQPPNVPGPDPYDVCANVYSVAPWDRVNLP